MSITISDIQSGIAAVEGFRDGLRSKQNALRERNRTFSANKRDMLYLNIQDAYKVALQLMKAENEDVLNALLARNGLKRDNRKGSNPWVAPVNLLFGKWVKTQRAGAGVSKPDRSAWKYAASFRYFYEHDWQATEIAAQLGKHHPRGLGGRRPFGRELVATQKEDAFKHGKQDANTQDHNKALKRFVERALPLAEVDKHAALINDGVKRQFVALWGIVLDGKVHVFGELPNRAEGVLSHALKAAGELDEYMKALEQNATKPPAKQNDPRTPKLVPRYLPPNIVNDKGHLVRKDGMTIVDIEAISDPHAAETTLTEEAPKLDAESPRATIEVPLPIKNGRHLEAATGQD